MTESLAAKFWKSVGEPDANGCLHWNGYMRSQGYGGLKFQGKTLSAHRVAYQISKGEIPSGMCVCHTCDVRNCVNSDHLFLGTIRENTQDRDRKGRHVPLPGELHGNAKLKESQVHEIRNASDTLQVIADRFGISKSQVFNIKHRKAWFHLEVAA